ncbi:MAG: component of SufBCD complex [Gemmobacter sp.]
MQWYETIFELIDMRSFSNLWFWIALAVLWSSASHYVMGVPWDLVLRARRKGGAAAEDVAALARINARRLAYIGDVAGLWLTGLTAFLLTALGVLGFVYDVEFCQAVFLLALPMTLVGALSMRTARAVLAQASGGEALYRRLRAQRRAVQAIGMVAIFFTALWGMYQNLNVTVLGL